MELHFYTDGNNYIIEFPVSTMKYISAKWNATGLSLDDKEVEDKNIIKNQGFKPVAFESLNSNDKHELKNILYKYLTKQEQSIISKNYYRNKDGKENTLPVYFADSKDIDKARINLTSKHGKEILVVYNNELRSGYTQEEYDQMSSWGQDSLLALANRTKENAPLNSIISNLKIVLP